MAASTAEHAEANNTADGQIDPRLKSLRGHQLALSEPSTSSKDQYDSEEEADYLEAKRYCEVEVSGSKPDLANPDDSESEAVNTNTAPAGSTGHSPAASVIYDWYNADSDGRSPDSPRSIVIVDTENLAENAAAYPEIDPDDEDSPLNVNIVGSVDWDLFAAECRSGDTSGESQESPLPFSAAMGNGSGFHESAADTAGEELQPITKSNLAERFEKWRQERDEHALKMQAAAKAAEDQAVGPQDHQLAPVNGDIPKPPKSPSFFVPRRQAPAAPKRDSVVMPKTRAGSPGDAKGNDVATKSGSSCQPGAIDGLVPAQKRACSFSFEDTGINVPTEPASKRRSSLGDKVDDVPSTRPYPPFLGHKQPLGRMSVGTTSAPDQVTAKAENIEVNCQRYAMDRPLYESNEKDTALKFEVQMRDPTKSIFSQPTIISVEAMPTEQQIAPLEPCTSLPGKDIKVTPRIYIVHQLRQIPVTVEGNTEGISPCALITLGAYTDLHLANERAAFHFLSVAYGHLTGNEHDEVAKIGHELELRECLEKMEEEGKMFDRGVGFADGTVWKFWVEQCELEGPGM